MDSNQRLRSDLGRHPSLLRYLTSPNYSLRRMCRKSDTDEMGSEKQTIHDLILGSNPISDIHAIRVKGSSVLKQ